MKIWGNSESTGCPERMNPERKNVDIDPSVDSSVVVLRSRILYLSPVPFLGAKKGRSLMAQEKQATLELQD